ncbi:GNAT family N-acetyltransferase [Paraferrimonas haliotis]|uniref:N-acetyltransferase n=1 Tax=Paraferrimonas haliotis TaxID=2013866 RepID=A0AA37TMW0_9GAMM|nr:GNAT family N-acetyltransferase [Paraferrimonas haliotis]GLS83263.1 N-acetyltransferase [Paraferrimonas haliotis]
MTIKIAIGNIEQAIAVEAQIPEFEQVGTYTKLAERLADKSHLILIAFDADTPVAYKVGYPLSNQEFYSWLGGVIPSHRKRGIATLLRQEQEIWVQEQGYRCISVKSMNRFPAMLQLLIDSGYQISGYIDKGTPDTSKICFTKSLNEHL